MNEALNLGMVRRARSLDRVPMLTDNQIKPYTHLVKGNLEHRQICEPDRKIGIHRITLLPIYGYRGGSR